MRRQKVMRLGYREFYEQTFQAQECDGYPTISVRKYRKGGRKILLSWNAADALLLYKHNLQCFKC